MRSVREEAVRRDARAALWGRGAPGAFAAACAAAVLLAAAAMLAAAMLAAAPARADIFPDLYRLTVTPDPEAGDARAAAIDLAMRGLLTRVTGIRNPSEDPALAGLIGDAASYVSSLGRIEGDEVQVEFYSNQIEQALASLNRPVFGPERPLTLLWIAIDGGGGERVLLYTDGIGADGPADIAGTVGVSPETTALAAAIREDIETVADERGLPIAFPLLDLEALTSNTSAEIWGGFVEQVKAASERYGADAILIGRIRANPIGNSVQWTLVRGERQSMFAGTDIVEGLHWLADTYVREYGVIGGARSVRLVVRGVTSLDDYGRVLSYLEGVSTLQAQSIAVEEYDSGVLSVRASARGDISVLEGTLRLGRVLRLDEEASSVADNTLLLRLVGGSSP